MTGLITRLSVSFAVVLIAALLVLMGFGFLAFALDQALLEHFSPGVTALLTGLAVFVIAALIVIIGAAINAAAKHKRRRDGEAFAIEISEFLSDEFVSLAATNPQATVLGALLSGFAVGVVPELRHVLREVLRKR
jgi:small-conductance mechanosensitive channel